jgi:hypothetical protein
MKTALKNILKKFRNETPETSDEQNKTVIEAEVRKFQKDRNKYLSLQNTRHFIL